MTTLRKFGSDCRAIVRRFDRDEAGMETVQIILILAVAAMTLMGTQKMCGVSAGESKNSGIFGSVGGLLGGLLDKGVGSFLGGFF